ncbi:MAG: hypothetical protein IKG39_02000 [Lachnospiraceae bacterium]|nr:hypothetical protein [Lachnospiraceae bacterium]
MELIDRNKVLKTIPSEEMVARMAVMSAPVVDAIPVSYIQQRIDRLRLLAEYEAEANGGYIGRSYMAKFELEELINYWKAEREQDEKNET